MVGLGAAAFKFKTWRAKLTCAAVDRNACKSDKV